MLLLLQNPSPNDCEKCCRGNTPWSNMNLALLGLYNGNRRSFCRYMMICDAAALFYKNKFKIFFRFS